jgi:hypothetical protein
MFGEKKDPFLSWKGDDFNSSFKPTDYRSNGDPFKHQDWKDGGDWRHGGNWNNQKFEKKKLFGLF